MTDRELMAEAVEIMLSAINSGDWKVDGACDPHASIIRLKNRLAQPEYVHASDISQEPVDETAKCGHECPEWDFMEIDKDSPEFDACLCFPKPSLWLAIAQDGRVKYTTDSGRASDWKKSGSYRLVRDYYTAPPKREWVWLTDEEVKKIVDKNTMDDYGYDIWCNGKAVARDVEAKLKEKNGWT